MKIRIAKKEDYKALMDLYNGFVEEDRYSNPGNDSFFKVLKSKSGHIYVLQEGRELVGFVSFSIRTIVRYPKPIAEVDEIFVSEKARGKHYGKKLLKKAMSEAKRAGCYRMFIETAYKWKIAHKMYERLGFKNNGYHFFRDL